jgi:hypothetical protein
MTDIREIANEQLRQASWWGGAGQALPELYVEQLITEINRLNQKLGMTEISIDHKTTLLNSCEKALADRDRKIAESRAQSLANVKADELERVKELICNQYDDYAALYSGISVLDEEIKQLRNQK